MDDKQKVKTQYKLQSTLMIIVSIIGIICYFIEIYTILFACIGILVVLIIIWRNWGKKVSKKYFNGRSPISKEDIMNL